MIHFVTLKNILPLILLTSFPSSTHASIECHSDYSTCMKKCLTYCESNGDGCCNFDYWYDGKSFCKFSPSPSVPRTCDNPGCPSNFSADCTVEGGCETMEGGAVCCPDNTDPYCPFQPSPTPAPSVDLPPNPTSLCLCDYPGGGTSGNSNSYTCYDPDSPKEVPPGSCNDGEVCYATTMFYLKDADSKGCHLPSDKTCSCNNPGSTDGGMNGYTCKDGTKSYCASDEVCFAAICDQGDWETCCSSESFKEERRRNV